MDALDRMFHVLVRTLRAKNPALLHAPFTVGELHSQILPYRHFRRELGLESNQEYELILMELLTGARGYLDVDERLRDELGKELVSPTPEPSRVREFVDAHVSVSNTAQAQVPEAPRPSTPTQAVRSTDPAVLVPPIERISGSNAEVAPNLADTRCRYCGGDLPSGRDARFCPHCGQNLQVLNCPACGAEVEAGWRYCITCGKSVA
ncbi:MAG TPA: zinc ribbon domain-containing protein [Gemmatimonadaceae bacterium]|nr:zinc ribbon domain-containing protein [Gemmatimonadaceae bacterium]